ncbi:MAG: hypothetical protein IJ252_05920, partial [Solobacterium sp.]|nr:hypothetical protein [Solobacterium sp.]
LLDVLPSDYMDVADFVKVFNYYKPYLGKYKSTEYSSASETVRITSRKNEKWIVYVGDVSESGAEFVYPSYTARRDFNSSIYDVWTIQSTSTITHKAVRNANTFNSTYKR